MSLNKKNILGISQRGVTLSADLSLRLRDDILSGFFRKDQKLSEQNICTRYQVSRTPVREALSQLEAEGLIKIIPNRGAFVLGISQEDLQDILVLRKIYEVQATRWAIERISESELDTLEETFEFMEFYTMKKDIKKMLNINQNFHQLIYNATHNQMLTRTLSSYQVYVKHCSSEPLDQVSYLDIVLMEHREIFHAFQNQDPEAGAVAMAKHMDNSMARF